MQLKSYLARFIFAWIIMATMLLAFMLAVGTAGASFSALKYCGPIDCWEEPSRAIFVFVYIFLALLCSLAADDYVKETS